MTVLTAARREKLGSRHARSLRAAGRFPATFQVDPKQPPLHISLDEHAFFIARHEHEHVYELEIDGEVELALIRELRWHVFAEHVDHIDFRRVVRGQKTEAEVELSFVGLSKGLVNHLMEHVTIRAVPTDIPDRVEVNVEGLEPGAVVLAGQLTLPEGVELVADPKDPVCNIAAPRGEEDEKEAEPAPEPGEVPLTRERRDEDEES